VPDRTAIILLAAGGSARMGRPKQLLPFDGTSLLRRAAQTALATPCRPVVAVLGAAAVECARELAGLDVHTSENTRWTTGMGSTLKVGLRRAMELDPALDAVLLMLCDQPLIGPADLARLLEARAQNSAPIVATAYPGSPGVPAIFSRATFPDLLALDDSAGAKSLLLAAGDRVVTLPIPAALADVDTPDDYARLRAANPPPAL
jgi:molybdenum cofactor cytidylyltransferase